MRLLLKLKTKGSFKYDLSYYHKAQGFIYNLLKDTDYGILHDKKDYKYFCFSNIFPIGDIKDNETRNFLISSPDRVFIKILFDKLSDLSNKKNSINIGEMEFFIDSIDVVNIKLKKKFNLITATPIIIRIPENKYEIYNIPHNFRKKRYVYWRPEYQVKAFVNQLEENLINKYRKFYQKNIKKERIIQGLKFNKSVSSRVVIEGKERIFIGSIWEFWFEYLNPKIKKIIEFGIECGLGERNSFGFGFVNPVY